MTLGGVTMNSQGDKLVHSSCFLIVAHSFTHVRPSMQVKDFRCMTLESTQRVELASIMTEGVW